MTSSPAGTPPRLVVRTQIVTFGAMAIVLGVAFASLTLVTRARVTRDVARNLDLSQKAFAFVESHQQHEVQRQASVMAESPTLKAALDTYQSEAHRADAGASPELVATVEREARKLATQLGADAVVVLDVNSRVLASTRPEAWAAGAVVEAPGTHDRIDDQILTTPDGTFRVTSVPLQLDDAVIGQLLVGTAINEKYLSELSNVSGVSTAVLVGGRVIAATLDRSRWRELEAVAASLPVSGVVLLGDDPHAVQQLFQKGSAQIYAVDSMAAKVATNTHEASMAILGIALAALALGVVVSWWTARSVANPIDDLSQQLRTMTSAQDRSLRLPRQGSSQELDALTDTFNELMSSLATAEAETEAAYVAAIKTLAAALDARDPYTAGHSERVSALSVMVGERLSLDERQIEVLRLGALLHDIGKIGIRDKVLTKNGPLSPDEYEIIKTHPTVGAHILRHVPFLTAHMPIVELHHEQPDGRGYPHGLFGDATPLLARIVHVADAFDAMTSARAYRPAQTDAHAIAELDRCRGTQFDPDVVDVFVAAWQHESTTGARAEVAPIVAAVRGVRGPVALGASGGRR